MYAGELVFIVMGCYRGGSFSGSCPFRWAIFHSDGITAGVYFHGADHCICRWPNEEPWLINQISVLPFNQLHYFCKEKHGKHPRNVYSSLPV